MPIDPKNMEAWVEGPPTAKQRKGSKSAPETPKEEPEAEAKAEGTLEERFDKLFPLLEAHGEDFEEATDPLNAEMLADESADFGENEEELQLLLDSVQALPPDLVQALKDSAEDLDWKTTAEIAEALEVGEHITDADRVAGYLFHLAQHGEELVVPEGDETGEDEEPNEGSSEEGEDAPPEE